jgi:pyrimidine deaminase RibD-like protein
MTAFSVGSLVVNGEGLILSTGYSREFGDSWHAEAVAIEKLLKESVKLSECTIYSSLEPCSVRKSGNKPCCSLILEHGIEKVVFAMREPPVFVNCCGAETLKSAGVTVVEIGYLADLVTRTNAHLINA